MVEDNKEIFEMSALISRFLLGEITGEEEERLEVWKKESEHNRGLFEELCSGMGSCLDKYGDNCSEKAFQRFVERRKEMENGGRRKLFVRWLKYAAVLVCPVALGAVLWWTSQKTDVSTDRVCLPDVVSHHFPTLTLADGKEVVLTDKKQELQNFNGALFAIPDTHALVYARNQQESVQLEYHTLTTPAQCDYQFTLSDGTRVWVNAASSVRFPVAFAKQERTIFVRGEVYLEVAPEVSRPFYVVTDGLKVRVLGTSFDVNAYQDEDFTTVTLCHGKVEVQLESRKYDLIPDQQLSLCHNNSRVKISAVNAKDYVSWREGHYVFKGQTLEDVAKVLRRWYDVEVVFWNQRSAKEIFTGIVNKEENLTVFLERLNNSSGVTAWMEDDMVYIR